jgi:hypothetical protein
MPRDQHFCLREHFNSKDHSIDDFRFAGREISRKNNTIYRQTRESLFIKMCNTQQEAKICLSEFSGIIHKLFIAVIRDIYISGLPNYKYI